MYVCLCHAVTDGDIHRAVADGARSLRDLRAQFRLATQCGRCGPCARECLRAALEQHDALDGPAAGAAGTRCPILSLPANGGGAISDERKLRATAGGDR